MGLVGGIFAPALFIGACLGVITFYLGSLFFNDVNPTLVIISTMAALGSCIIGGPIANVLIVFELTSNYEAALSSGICIVVATIISSQLIGQSTFDQLLNARSIDIQDGRDILYLKGIKIKEIINTDYLKFKGNITVKTAVDEFSKNECSEAYFVDDNNALKSKIVLTDIINQNGKKYLKDLNKTKFLTISSNENLIDVIEKCKEFIGESIPVVDDSGKLLGIFSENDLFLQYANAQEYRKKEETRS
tara:strand:- start:596 stop:1336 length:741 start_codon:yes stop_codon:yes gene_type:complete